jgi:hypothetical protein
MRSSGQRPGFLWGVRHKERFPCNTEVLATIAWVNLGRMGLEPGHIPGTPRALRLRLRDGGGVHDLFEDQGRVLIWHGDILVDDLVLCAGEKTGLFYHVRRRRQGIPPLRPGDSPYRSSRTCPNSSALIRAYCGFE